MSADMLLTKTMTIVLPSGDEFYFAMDDGTVDEEGKPTGDPDIDKIIIFPNNITINYKTKGPMVWLMQNIAGFSHDKEISVLTKATPEVVEQEPA